MTARFRPVHSGFETLRFAGAPRNGGARGCPSAASEQLTAIAYARFPRPNQIFSDFVQR
ncbi:hypothetical protein [Xaviernesmea oryzae]|uniref:hypothetical protein n=1 Tax=Xaviernesmea oryzae TaxID=464029 RepID=UPI0008C5C8F3|nr:hypothetical protein [Xaviernesmea oryzae]SEL74296.1 hypothetical protein SAMN04487976_11224 [Xaviernesmea oryzae]